MRDKPAGPEIIDAEFRVVGGPPVLRPREPLLLPYWWVGLLQIAVICWMFLAIRG